MDCSTPGSSVLRSLLVCSNSCPLSQWRYLATSSSAGLFSFCHQSHPASGSFPSASFLQWTFRVDFLGFQMPSEPAAHQAPFKVASIICLPLTIQVPDQMPPSLRHFPEPPRSINTTTTRNASSSLSLSHHLVCIICHLHLVTRHGRQGLYLIGYCFPKHQPHSMCLRIKYWMDEWRQLLEASPNCLVPSPENNIYIIGVKAC